MTVKPSIWLPLKSLLSHLSKCLYVTKAKGVFPEVPRYTHINFFFHHEA